MSAELNESVESWRVFCAAPLPAEVREIVGEYIARLRSAAPEVRAAWGRADNLHVTLKFLGSVERGRIAALSAAAGRAAGGIPPFELVVEGAGAFPPHRPARVLWLGLKDPSGNLARLSHVLEDECARAGFAREGRPFNPHLTIARLRSPEGARKLARMHAEAGFNAVRFDVKELRVIRSELGPGGPRYTELSGHELHVA